MPLCCVCLCAEMPVDTQIPVLTAACALHDNTTCCVAAGPKAYLPIHLLSRLNNRDETQVEQIHTIMCVCVCQQHACAIVALLLSCHREYAQTLASHVGLLTMNTMGAAERKKEWDKEVAHLRSTQQVTCI